MFCKYCGTEISNDAKFCPSCGKPVEENNSTTQTNLVQQELVDTGSFGWGVLGFFIPLVGLILYLVWKPTRPKDAAMAGKGALISVIASVVLLVLSIIIQGVAMSQYYY